MWACGRPQPGEHAKYFRQMLRISRSNPRCGRIIAEKAIDEAGPNPIDITTGEGIETYAIFS